MVENILLWNGIRVAVSLLICFISYFIVRIGV